MKRAGLVADAGGTNVRFALIDLDRPQGGLVAPRKYASKDFARIQDAARTYLDEQQLGAPPAGAVIAVAGPVKDNAIAMTNLGWHFSGRELGGALGIQDIRLINDFEAVAFSIDALNKTDLRDIGPAVTERSSGRRTVAIVGPGTGFGVGGYVSTGGRPVALVAEGGHVDFAPVDDLEIEILKVLRTRFGRVSTERVLSGPGLCNIHDAMSSIEGVAATARDARQITAQALDDPNSFCGRVLARFCAMLGSAAGNVVLTLGARDGLFIAGGIGPAIADFLMTSEFRARFEAKGRFQTYMKEIPTRLIVQGYVGLIGAAISLRAGGDD